MAVLFLFNTFYDISSRFVYKEGSYVLLCVYFK